MKRFICTATTFIYADTLEEAEVALMDTETAREFARSAEIEEDEEE